MHINFPETVYGSIHTVCSFQNEPVTVYGFKRFNQNDFDNLPFNDSKSNYAPLVYI